MLFVLVLTVLVAAALFVALMVVCPPFNRLVASSAGAPPGRSFSAHLWATEPYDKRAKAARMVVDLLFLYWQDDHCRKTWERDE